MFIYTFRLFLFLTCLAGLLMQLYGSVTQQLDLPLLLDWLLSLVFFYGVYLAHEGEVQ
jgi:hypothetical protein